MQEGIGLRLWASVGDEVARVLPSRSPPPGSGPVCEPTTAKHVDSAPGRRIRILVGADLPKLRSEKNLGLGWRWLW